jgi:dTDP-4-amino-4,6-dideoxygalactose transaminase
MSKVPFFSLAAQSKLLKQEVLNVIAGIIDNTSFILGEDTANFEKDFAKRIGSAYALGVSNGTVAIYMALKALDVSEGDEVILPAATFTASAQAICQIGATPVFADIEPDTWTIDPKSIEVHITKKTKAIMPVHLYGNPCAMNEIKAIAARHNLYIIEDAAQSHGASYDGQYTGSFGDMACFSFYPSKNLGAMGDAGALCFQDVAYEEKLKAYRNCGKNAAGSFEFMGFNYRMSNIQAAVLNLKLPLLNDWNDKRRAIANQYIAGIRNEKLQHQVVKDKNRSAYHLFVLKTDDRKKFCSHLEANEVGYAFHYETPLHLQKPYAFLSYKEGSLPNTEDLFSKCVSIPLFPEMDEWAVERVIEVINKY